MTGLLDFPFSHTYKTNIVQVEATAVNSKICRCKVKC